MHLVLDVLEGLCIAYQLDVSFGIDQKVVWRKIPMNVTSSMHFLDGLAHLDEHLHPGLQGWVPLEVLGHRLACILNHNGVVEEICAKEPRNMHAVRVRLVYFSVGNLLGYYRGTCSPRKLVDYMQASI